MDTVSNVGVLDKAVAVLRALERVGPAGLADLQSATGLPRATAHRLATALEQHGLVRRDRDGRFELGLALVGLGQAAADGFPLAELARPTLTALRDETGESVQLFVREHDGRRCVVSLQSSHGLRWIVPEGALLPSPSARPVGCCPAPSAPTGGSRASRSARPAWPRSARRSSVATATCSPP